MCVPSSQQYNNLHACVFRFLLYAARARSHHRAYNTSMQHENPTPEKTFLRSAGIKYTFKSWRVAISFGLLLDIKNSSSATCRWPRSVAQVNVRCRVIAISETQRLTVEMYASAVIYQLIWTSDLVNLYSIADMMNDCVKVH